MTRAPQDKRSWQFYELTREIVFRTPGTASPGVGADLRQEAVRYRGNPSLAFPTRDVEQVEDVDDYVRIDVNFNTLYGVDGPLPPYLTEEIIQAEQTPLYHGDDANTRVRDFLDIFNHRLLSLLYRSWAAPRLSTRLGRWGTDDLTRQLDDLLDLPELDDELLPFKPRLMGVAALLWQRPRSASGLLKLLRHVFPGMLTELSPCVPSDVELPPPQRSALGSDRARLGQSWRLGRTVRSVNIGVQVTVLDSGDHDLRPGRPARRLLAKLVEHWIDQPLHLDLIVSDDAPRGRPFVLGDPERSGRLGDDLKLTTPTATPSREAPCST